jgi:hypothetical protein
LQTVKQRRMQVSAISFILSLGSDLLPHIGALQQIANERNAYLDA